MEVEIVINDMEVEFNKRLLLSILDYFVDVCQKNGLKYYLAGGSVLGAVRHKGFIPTVA